MTLRKLGLEIAAGLAVALVLLIALAASFRSLEFVYQGF
jgi:hypothetical protein